MKGKIYRIAVIIFIAFTVNTYSQTLVAAYDFPNYNQYNAFWGVTQINDSLWIGTSFSPSKLYKVTKTGTIADSLTTPFTYNHGLAWEGNGFWIAQDFTSGGAHLYKIDRNGNRLDTINTNANMQGIGGIALDGNNIWVASYYPDFTVYPYAFAYKINLTTKTVTDTIPLRGKQVQGIAVKGDTIFYVNDNFQGEAERIYAYRKVTGDTLFSFAAPDPDNDCDPRGLFWDGQYLWLIANRIGNNINQYRTLYKYAITGQGSPQITTSTSAVNFGNVVIGATANQNLTITNSGTSKLIISNYTNTNPVFGISPNTVPDTINPGSFKNYTLSFTPTVFDTTGGQLRITSNDIATPVKIVNLRGKGVYNGANIGFSSASNNYNSRRVNSLSGFTFDVTNRGTQPLVITAVNFASQRFRLDMTNVTFPINIDTQRTRTLRVWFNPNAANSFSDSAVFVSNAVNSSSSTITLTGTGQANNSALGDIFWEGNIPNDPNSGSQDYQPKSLKQIPDVNGDGVNDIIVCTANYWTICYNGNSSGPADTLWKFSTDFGSINTGSVTYKDAMQIIDDVNGDGIKDVVIGCGGGNEEVYVLSGKDGKVIWVKGDPIATADGDINGIRTDKDFNNDGVKDVIVSASGEGNGTGRHSVICYNGLNGNVLFNTVESSHFCADVVTTNSGGGIGFSYNGGPYGVYGFTNSGSNSWTYSTTSSVWSLKQVPDLNGDGNTDIIGMYGFNGGLFAISGSAGSEIWASSLGSSNNGTIELLDDKDKNGFIDFTYSGPQVAYRIDSKTNTILWQNAFGSSFIRDCEILGDLNNDSIAEVLYSTQQPGKVFVLDGATGQALYQYTFGTTINERADRICKLNSIDGNFSNEFVAGSRDGRIKCFSGGINGVIGVSPVSTETPNKFALYQNFPNPFNPSTQIKFDIPSIGGRLAFDVKLVIYDILGREVVTLVNQNLNAGFYKVVWNASNYSSGIYFYEINAGEFTSIQKMVLVK